MGCGPGITPRSELTKSSSPSSVGWLSRSGRGDAGVLSLCKQDRNHDVGDRQREESDGEEDKRGDTDPGDGKRDAEQSNPG